MFFLPVTRSALLCFLPVLIAFCQPAQAIEILNNDQWALDADISAGFGMFNSNESYIGAPGQEAGSAGWSEGYYKAGFSFTYTSSQAGAVYGSVNYLGSATWRDGDPAGNTTGEERRNAVEDAYFGWRSADLLPGLGLNGVDVSLGRQEYKIGNGFLIEGDAFNLGKGYDGVAPESLNRGGTYYMASRLAFDRTAILRLGSKQWRGEFFWFDSDNPAQAKTEMLGMNLMWVNDHWGTVGLTFLHGLDVDNDLADFLGLGQRDGQDTYSIRYQGSAGIENLVLEAEWVSQDSGPLGNERAWYARAGWKFSQAGWAPEAGLRYSQFSADYDTLFYGLSTGYGTWFQGEVAGNFAGPFNNNANIWHGYVTAQPLENVALGVLYFNYDTRDRNRGNLDGREVDLYAIWQITGNISFSPLVGFFSPDRAAANGGSQLGSNDTNFYVQATVLLSF